MTYKKHNDAPVSNSEASSLAALLAEKILNPPSLTMETLASWLPDKPRNRLDATIAKLTTQGFALANAKCEADTGKSLFEIVLLSYADRVLKSAHLDFNVPGSFLKNWPYYIERLPTKVGRGWLPLNSELLPLGYWFSDIFPPEFRENETSRWCFPPERFVHQAWHFPGDPKELPGVWKKRRGGLIPSLYLQGRMRRIEDFRDYLERLGRMLNATGENGLTYMVRLLRTLP